MLPSGSDHPRRSARIGAPYLVPLGFAIAAVVALYAARGRLASLGTSLASPETQIRHALASQTRVQLEDVYGFGFRGGGSADLAPVSYRDVVLSSSDAGRATVTAVLEAQGSVAWRDEVAHIAYVGRELFHLRACDIAFWCAEGDQFARLRGVLLVLSRREEAFNARDAGAYANLVSPKYRDEGIDRDALLRRIAVDFRDAPLARQRILAWQIRAEGAQVEVGEDYTIAGAGGAPHRRRARYTLERDGEGWVFVAGL